MRILRNTNMNNPINYYKRKIYECEVKLERIIRKSSMYLYGKLLFFVIAVLCLYIYCFHVKSELVVILFFFNLLSYFLCVFFDNREIEKKKRYSRIKRNIKKANTLQMMVKFINRILILLLMTLISSEKIHYIIVSIEQLLSMVQINSQKYFQMLALEKKLFPKDK